MILLFTLGTAMPIVDGAAGKLVIIGPPTPYKKYIESHKKIVELFEEAHSEEIIEALIKCGTAECLLGAGESLMRIGAYRDAIECFDRAIILSPSKDMEAVICAQRGFVYGVLDEYEEAIDDFDEAIYTNSSFAGAYYYRGVAYYMQGQYEEAIDDLDEAIYLNPDFADAYSSRGAVYITSGEYEEAIEYLDRALSILDELKWSLMESTGDYIEGYETTLDPFFAEAYYNRGVAYYLQEQYEEAIEDFDEAIYYSNYDFAEAYYNRGVTYYMQGQYKEAIEDFDEATYLNPDFADINPELKVAKEIWESIKPTPTPKTTPTPTPTHAPTPKPTPTPTPTPTPPPTPLPTLTPALLPSPSPYPKPIGFEVIFAIAGLLAITAYFIIKQKRYRK